MQAANFTCPYKLHSQSVFLLHYSHMTNENTNQMELVSSSIPYACLLQIQNRHSELGSQFLSLPVFYSPIT